jgi:hypothetical protein
VIPSATDAAAACGDWGGMGVQAAVMMAMVKINEFANNLIKMPFRLNGTLLPSGPHIRVIN